MLITLMMMAATNAMKKFSKIPPVRLSESLNQTVRSNIRVLITRVNKPKVITVIGRVNSLIIGRMKAFIKPKMTATSIRLRTLPLKFNPANNILVSQIATALISIRRISFILGLLRILARFILNGGYCSGFPVIPTTI